MLTQFVDSRFTPFPCGPLRWVYSLPLLVLKDIKIAMLHLIAEGKLTKPIAVYKAGVRRKAPKREAFRKQSMCVDGNIEPSLYGKMVNTRLMFQKPWKPVLIMFPIGR